MLKFKIRNQQISRVDSFRPVEKSVNYLYAEFTFCTADWDSAEKKAVCKNLSSGQTYDAAITDNKCLIPWEAIDEKGGFELSVWGTVGDVTVPTGVVTVELGRTLKRGIDSNPPTPTEIDLIKQDIVDIKEQLEQGGEDGGYYTPAVTQPSDTTLQFAFAPSKADMPAVQMIKVDLPVGPQGPQGEMGPAGPQGVPGDDYVLTDADKTEIAEQAAALVEVPDAYTLPVGGAELGGVKNGGNVTINADGTMTAPESSGIAVTGAAVGQTVKIAEVDENGVPTAWEPTDFPSGGGLDDWRFIRKVTIPNDPSTDTSGVSYLEKTGSGSTDYIFAFDTDENGEPFELTEVFAEVYAGSTCTTSTARSMELSVSKTPAITNNLTTGFQTGINSGYARGWFKLEYLGGAYVPMSVTDIGGGGNSIWSPRNIVGSGKDRGWITAISMSMGRNFAVYGFMPGSTFTFYGR